MNGELLTFIANLKYQIQQNKPLELGGGFFSVDELKVILTILESK